MGGAPQSRIDWTAKRRLWTGERGRGGLEWVMIQKKSATTERKSENSPLRRDRTPSLWERDPFQPDEIKQLRHDRLVAWPANLSSPIINLIPQRHWRTKDPSSLGKIKKQKRPGPFPPFGSLFNCGHETTSPFNSGRPVFALDSFVIPLRPLTKRL